MKKSNTHTMLAGLPVTQGGQTPTRAAILLWGASTVGKTTFSATAPGDKLWLSFGDQEHVSVMSRKDVRVLKLHELSISELFKHGQDKDNPFGLDQYLSANEDVATVVCDSATALAYSALHHSVANKVGAGKGFIPTIEMPGISAYGGRNGIVLEVLTGLLRVTAKHNVHLIVTAHEGDPQTKIESGKELIDYIGVMLGGQLVNNMTYRFSEIWYMSQEDYGDKSRKIAFRPTRRRKPMKTRMFQDNTRDVEFTLRYDATKPDKGQMTIAGWVNAWLDNNGAKIPVPGSK